MNLSDQVCSLEYARRLKELGVKQHGYFSFFRIDEEYFIADNAFDDFIASAFTVAELGELLPKTIEKSDVIYFLTITRPTPFVGWHICYENKGHYLMDNRNIHLTTLDVFEVNARAEMLIKLIEQGHVKECK